MGEFLLPAVRSAWALFFTFSAIFYASLFLHLTVHLFVESHLLWAYVSCCVLCVSPYILRVLGALHMRCAQMHRFSVFFLCLGLPPARSFLCLLFFVLRCSITFLWNVFCVALPYTRFCSGDGFHFRSRFLPFMFYWYILSACVFFCVHCGSFNYCTFLRL